MTIKEVMRLMGRKGGLKGGRSKSVAKRKGSEAMRRLAEKRWHPEKSANTPLEAGK